MEDKKNSIIFSFIISAILTLSILAVITNRPTFNFNMKLEMLETLDPPIIPESLIANNELLIESDITYILSGANTLNYPEETDHVNIIPDFTTISNTNAVFPLPLDFSFYFHNGSIYTIGDFLEINSLPNEYGYYQTQDQKYYVLASNWYTQMGAVVGTEYHFYERTGIIMTPEMRYEDADLLELVQIIIYDILNYALYGFECFYYFLRFLYIILMV